MIAVHPKKTVVVANFGTWLKRIEEFQQAFEAFFSWIDTSPLVESKEKLGPIFFRETIPRHYMCKPEGKKENVKTYNWKVPLIDAPFESYREYIETLVTHTWGRRGRASGNNLKHVMNTH